MRKGPVKHDSRTIRDEQLRLSEPLPLRRESKDGEELYYYEAQTSSLSWGPDEWFWTEIFLVDTWYGSEESYKTYVRDELDPPLAGGRRLKYPCYDPREYFLLKLERRLEQAVNEYHALIGTFHKRMKEYVRLRLSNTFNFYLSYHILELITNTILDRERASNDAFTMTETKLLQGH